MLSELLLIAIINIACTEKLVSSSSHNTLDDDDMYCHEEERIEFEGIQCEDKGVNTEIQMKDEAMNTDVELKDKGVNTQEDHCYCRRYVQEESEHSSVIIECAEHRHFTQHVQVEEKAINTDAGMDSRFLSTSSPFEMLKGDDSQTHFYTSLRSYKMLETILTLLNPLMAMKNDTCKLSHGDELLLVCMKLRLAMPHEDLSYRFRIAVSSVSKIFHRWIDVMSRELHRLICWPDRTNIRQTLPDCFKPMYSHATCIIDCSEIFLERPSSLLARAQTYSQYKHHNTVKFLMAISPTGAIIFLSKCWGGRVSDKYLTANCGFYKYLIPGDLVLADRGFNIADDLALHGASLALPSFTKGKDQLSQNEVEVSRSLSRVRIHVERAIGRLKHFKLLQLRLPISMIKTSKDTHFSTIDKILIVCAALCNLNPPLVQ